MSSRILGLAALVVAVMGGNTFAQETGQNVNNIFPVAPRELRQHLTRAQAAVAEERFSDAVFEIGEVLNSAEGDDYFLGALGSPDAQVSLKSQALALLGSMPQKGRQLYELQYGAEAKAALESALTAGDLQQLTEVSRRYFHTKAGYEATMLLGRVQLDQGRPLAAALTLKRVSDVPHAAAQYDPELAILLATCWVHANQPDQAKAALVALKARLPSAKVKLVGEEVSLFETDDAALAWLEEIVGGGRIARAATATQWVMFRGSETRNAATQGGVPLLNFNWKQPTVFDPQDGDKIAQLLRATRDRNDPIVSVLQPLVVQDYVIVRQPEANRLAGISLKTGKIVWVYPPFDENPAITAVRQTLPTGRTPAANVREQELKQRVWEDNAFGQASSDGRQVYVIDELGYAPMINVTSPQVFIVAGGRRVPNTGLAKSNNTLIALDLKKQGYQNWAIGDKGDNPALASAFFLGPPLPLGDQLFALAEQSGDIRLLCLSSKDGGLEWKQQLAVVEEALPIAYDRVRRLAGASPSYADGVLVCPTSAGAVVAVDLVTRSLRWGYQYSRWDLVRNTSSAIAMSSQGRNPTQGNWLDGTATIADGSVVLTPVESQELHCLDLLTGKARWPAQPRDDMLFVACIHEGKIVLVGKNKIKGVKLADGSAAWATLDLGNETPTGRGYYSGRHYFLPITGQHLLKIDVESGKIVGRAKTEVDLGNVVCYQDQLITQGPQTVAAFFLSEPLQARLEEDLKRNPNDLKALALKGQVLLQEGKTTESLDVLRQAHKQDPASEPIRSLLVKVMLALLRDDFTAHVGLTEELEQLVTDPVQRREALRWRVKGLTQTGKTWEAFESIMELADFELVGATTLNRAAGGLEYIDRDLAVRTDRWLQGRVQELLKAADSQTKAKMSAEIEVRLKRVLEAGNPNQLRVYLNLFGFQDSSHAAKLALADQLIAADQLLEAELLVGEMLKLADPPVAGAVRAALATLYEKAKRPELAARYYQELARNYGEVPCRDGLTGKQLAERAAAVESVKPYLAAAWPVGQTEVQHSPAAAAGEGRNLGFGQRMSYAVQIAQFAGAAPRGLKVQYDQSQQLSIRSDLGNLLTNAAVRSNDGTIRRYIAVPNNALTARAHGHLVLVNFGAEVIAIDALRGERAAVDSLLWRQESADLDLATSRSLYAQQRTVNNPLVGTRYISYDSSGRLNFNTGPLQMAGVCYQKGRLLICADLLTGQSIWERGQIPAQAEIFGDGEMIFVADAAGEVQVLSAIDGTLLGKRKIERSDRRWTTYGRNVLAWDQVGTTLKVRLYDVWQQDAKPADTVPAQPAEAVPAQPADNIPAGQPADLWSHQVPQGTKGCVIDGEEVALLEPSGQLTVVSLDTGELKFAVPLEPEPSLDYVVVQRSRDQYVLMTMQNNPTPPPGLLVNPLSSANSPQARIHGRAYAFARSTGKLQWQVPAFVAMHALPIDQPAESPLLLFVRNRTDVKEGGANRQAASVLCLDKRDGRVVFDSDTDPNLKERRPPAANHSEIIADPVKRTVTLSLNNQATPTTFVFQVTDKPFPPQPPAQTGEVASTSVGELPGTVDQSVGQAVERLNRGEDPSRLFPAAPPVRGISPRPPLPR